MTSKSNYKKESEIMKNYIEETLLVITITVISMYLLKYYITTRMLQVDYFKYAIIFPIFLIIYLFTIIALKKNSK